MLSSVLNSRRAVSVNITIMRAFVRFRAMIVSHRELASRIDALEERYDGRFKIVFDAIRELMAPPRTERRPIGFKRSVPDAESVTAIGSGSTPDRRGRSPRASARR